MNRTLRAVAIATTIALTSNGTRAVEVDPDGLGQALIFPYYTVRTADGGPFNTYVSIVNNSLTDAKAVRVRFREGRNAKAVADINVFLGPRDAWVAALVPDTSGVLLLTRDASCTDPALGSAPGGVALPAGARGLLFGDATYTGANADGGGTEPGRKQEGFIEAFEMATIVNIPPLNALNAIVHREATGIPSDCASVRGLTASTAAQGTFAAPTGGLSGSATLINVANGADYTYAAEALANLVSVAYYTPPTSAGADFASAPVDPVSMVVAGGVAYRSRWARGLDAINAALMRRAAFAEFTTEAENGARTDVVITLPTRHFALASGTAAAPFAGRAWSLQCATGGGQGMTYHLMDRAQRQQILLGRTASDGFAPRFVHCGCVNASAMQGETLTGSQLGGVSRPSVTEGVLVPVRSGMLKVMPGDGYESAGTLQSLPDSTRVDLATGIVTQGSHVLSGLPMAGFALRSLRNGFLTCGTGTCLGNYGSVFPYRYERSIVAAP